MLKSHVYQIIFGLLCLAVLSLPLWLTPAFFRLRNFGGADITQLLSSLFLVALFLERALEVFVSTWRDPGANDLDLSIQTQEQVLSKLQSAPPVDTAALGAAQDALNDLGKRKVAYRSKTKRIALWAGLTLGLVVSAVGIRTLEALVEPQLLADAANKAQVIALRVVDVLLTGALLAGGSDGIHQLANVYTSFMEATAKRAKG